MKYLGNEIIISFGDNYNHVIRLYPNDTPEEMIRQDYDHPDGNSCQHDYDCCGHWYAGALKIIRSSSKGGYTQTIQYWCQNV